MAKDEPTKTGDKATGGKAAERRDLPVERRQQSEADARHEAEARQARSGKERDSLDSSEVARAEREAGMHSPGLRAEDLPEARGDLRPDRPAPRLVYYEGGPCPICGAAVAPAATEKPKEFEGDQTAWNYEGHHRLHHAAAPMPVFMKEATASSAQSKQQGTAAAPDKSDKR